MKWRHRAAAVAFLVAVAGIAWMIYAGFSRTSGRPAVSGDAAAAGGELSPDAGRKIKARLFYVAPDGKKLVSVERDVPFGEATAEQARAIVAAQIAPVDEPLLSAVPPGTTLRALFVTEAGDAYVDLSSEASSAHPGGTLNELLTIYTIVNAVTANLPAVSGVQILINGREVDTLAGHVDLRRPLTRDLSWVQ